MYALRLPLYGMPLRNGIHFQDQFNPLSDILFQVL